MLIIYREFKSLYFCAGICSCLLFFEDAVLQRRAEHIWKGRVSEAAAASQSEVSIFRADWGEFPRKASTRMNRGRSNAMLQTGY